MKHLVWVLALAPLQGCFLARSTINEPIAPSRVAATAQLTPGTSTQADVLAMMGAPEQVVELYRRSAWLYQHAKNKRTYLWLGIVVLSNSDEQSDRVWVFFDENGKYMCSGASLRADTASYELPWSDAHQLDESEQTGEKR